MSGEASSQQQGPSTTIPRQPYQLLDGDYHFTPYYVSKEIAHQFRTATPLLGNNLRHPPENFPEARNIYPGSDPIMDARRKDGERPGELSYEEVMALKHVEDMTAEERRGYDAKEFAVVPPVDLTEGQKQRWAQLYKDLLEMKAGSGDEDSYKMRPRGELRKLKKLADLAGGKQT